MRKGDERNELLTTIAVNSEFLSSSLVELIISNFTVNNKKLPHESFPRFSGHQVCLHIQNLLRFELKQGNKKYLFN